MLSQKNYSNIHFHTNQPWLITEIIEKYGLIRHSKIQDMFHNIKPQKRIGFVTDSGADIERELKYANDVYTIPLGINVNGCLYYDNLTIVTHQLLKKLDDVKYTFNTVSPSDGIIKKTIDEALLHYQYLIITLVSSKMSGTYRKISKLVNQNADYAKRILVIDSCMNSASQGLLLKKIIETDFKDLELNQIAEYIEQLKIKITTYVVVNDFNNLSKTGRVPTKVAKVAEMLKMHAILTLDNKGNGKAFGLSLNSIKCHNKILKQLIKDNKQYKISDVVIYYSNQTAQMREFVKDVDDILDHQAITQLEIAPSTALHVGKDCYAICYQKEDFI